MVSEDKMIGIYNRWLEREGLPVMCAEELRFELLNQLQWIERFLKVYPNSV